MTLIRIDTMNDLAASFCSATNDRRRQDIVDQLGTHPLNHADFIRAVYDHCIEYQYDTCLQMADYFNATVWLRGER